MTRSCEEDPAFDYLLMLFLDAVGEPLTVLPTHRIVARARRRRASRRCWRGLDDLFDGPARRLGAPSCASASAPPALARGGEGRFGLWTRAGRRAADGSARRRSNRSCRGRRRPAAGSMSRCSASRSSGWPGSMPRRSRPGPSPTRSRRDEAIDRVDAGLDGADAAFLLEPTPVASVVGGRRRSAT